MTLDFRSITETLAKHLVARREFLGFIRTIGVDVADWPEGKPRRIAETYIALREKENHEYAVHILAADAQTLKIHHELPLEPGALRVLYRDQLKIYRTKRLADQLAVSEPDQYERLIGEYLNAETREIKLYNFTDEIKPLLEATEAAVKENRARVAIPGWERLSEAIGGFNPGRVNLLVADTGFGKTNAALNIARCAASVGPVLFINMEMMAADLGDRLLLAAADMRFGDYKAGRFNWAGLDRAASDMAGKRLVFTDGKTLSIQEIYALARQEKSRSGLFMVFVDYDQKLRVQTSRDMPEWKALQIAVEQLEELAKRLEINVMLMSQSNEDGDPSGSKRSKYAASTVLRFYKADQKTVIQAVKNRFGAKDAAVEVAYQPDKGLVAEVGHADVETMKAPRARVK